MSKSKAAPLRRSTRQKRPALNMPLPGVAHLRPPSKTSDTDSSSDDDISLGGTPRPTSPDSSPPRTDDDHDGTFHETGDETHTVEPTTTQTTASSSSLTDRPLPTSSTDRPLPGGPVTHPPPGTLPVLPADSLPRALDALPTPHIPMAPPDSLAHAHTTPPTSTPSMPSTFSNPPHPPAFPSRPLAPTQHLSNITDPAHLSSFGTVSESKYSSYTSVPDAKRSRSRDRSPPRSAASPLQKAMQTLWYDSVNTVGRGENNHWKRFLQNGPNTQGLSHLQQQWLRDFPIYEESKDLTTWLSDLETRLPTAWDVWAKVSILHQRLNAKHQHLFAGALDRLTRRRDDLTWEEIRQAFIFSLKGRATSLLLEQRMRRINQRDGEPFRTYIGRAYDELVKVIGTRPNDDQLTRVVVAGANISTARQIQHYRNDAATLWDLQELVEEWEHREWRLLGLPDPFHDPTRAVPGGAERQESTALAAQSTPLDRDLQCGWCSKVGHHENGCSQPMYCDQCVEQTHPKKDCTKYRQRLFNVHNERHAQVALAHPRVMQALQTPAVPTAVTQPDIGATLAPTSSLATLTTSAQDWRPSRRNWQDQK